MPRARAQTRVRLLAVCGFVLVSTLLASTAPVAAADPMPLGGRVRDSLGNLLEGVEILIADSSGASLPIGTALSDGDGRFAISDLAPAAYRVAALKRGYLTFIGRVDTKIEHWLEVVLRPAGDAGRGDASTPNDASWMLRLPRRSVFRETEPTAEPPTPATAAPEAADGRLQLQFDHLFTYGPGTEAESPASVGMETQVRVASAVGDRGRLRVEGRREKIGSSEGADEFAGEAERQASALSVDFSYDTSADAELAVRAYYRERDLEWALPASRQAVHRQEVQDFGYASSWSTRLDDETSMVVRFDYSSMVQSSPGRLLGDAGGMEVPRVGDLPETRLLGEMANQTVAAAGSIESLPSDDHRVLVRFQARLQDSPLDGRAGVSGSSPWATAESAWSLGVDAQDTWELSAPFALVYGLGYRHELTGPDAVVLVPRVGGTWRAAPIVVRFMVSYHTVAGSQPEPIGSLGSKHPAGAVPWSASTEFLPDGELGYHADVELPLASGLQLRGSTAYSPMQFDFTAADPGAAEAVSLPTYRTDAGATVRRTTFGLVQQLGQTRTYLELADGSLSGPIVPLVGLAAPWVAVPSEVSYWNGSWGVRIGSTGTDLHLEYRRLTEFLPRIAGEQATQKLESMELRLTQDLFRLHSLGSWRLLMALRRTTSDSDDGEGSTPDGDASLLAGLSTGVSAGLSVKF